MPDVRVEKAITLDPLSTNAPATSATSDMPVIETKPDSTPATEAPETPEAATEAEATVTTTAESAPADKPGDSPASDAQAKKPAQGVQKRIDELTKQREEANRRADAVQAMLDRALSVIEGKPPQSAAQPTATPTEEAEPKKPDRNTFTDPDAYDAAMDTYVQAKAEFVAKREVGKALDANNKAQQERTIAEQQRVAREAYGARVEKAKVKYPDYKEVAESPNVTVSIPMAHAIAHSDDGPEIAYYLGKNPQEAQRIATLSPPVQLLELGKIAVRLASPTAPKPQVTAAPKPITPIVTGADASTATSEEESMDAYAARRQKQLADERSKKHLRH